jgi:two-component sensor histidine kinase
VAIRRIGGVVRCHVEDDGSTRDLPVQPGTGLSIVNALARELAGTFDQRFHSSGSVSTLTFPLS